MSAKTVLQQLMGGTSNIREGLALPSMSSILNNKDTNEEGDENQDGEEVDTSTKKKPVKKPSTKTTTNTSAPAPAPAAAAPASGANVIGASGSGGVATPGTTLYNRK